MHQSLVFKRNLTERDFKERTGFHTYSAFSPANPHKSRHYSGIEVENQQLYDDFDDWSADSLEAGDSLINSPIQSDVDNNSVGCNHEEHKDAVVIPKSAGGSIMGAGIKAGTGKIVIVCKKCHTYYDVERGPPSDDV